MPQRRIKTQGGQILGMFFENCSLQRGNKQEKLNINPGRVCVCEFVSVCQQGFKANPEVYRVAAVCTHCVSAGPILHQQMQVSLYSGSLGSYLA